MTSTAYGLGFRFKFILKLVTCNFEMLKCTRVIRGEDEDSYTHRLGDQESGEEIEEGVEKAGADGRELRVGCEGDHHHAVVCEGDEAEE